MRDVGTSTKTFRQLLREISLLMGYEITRNLPLIYQPVTTPLTTFDAPVISGKKLAVVPILRAGVGMAEGLLELIPSARVGHIGVYRDHTTHRPVEYLVKLPEPEGRSFILTDPMLATGYSAIHAVDVLLRAGVKPDNIRFLALVAAPEGIEVFSHHPGCRFMSLPSTNVSTRTPISSPASVTPETGCSARSSFLPNILALKKKKKNNKLW